MSIYAALRPIPESLLSGERDEVSIVVGNTKEFYRILFYETGDGAKEKCLKELRKSKIRGAIIGEIRGNVHDYEFYGLNNGFYNEIDSTIGVPCQSLQGIEIIKILSVESLVIPQKLRKNKKEERLEPVA